MVATRHSPLVSVVIPHRGEDKTLEKCLKALRSQTFSSKQIEVLIVLNEEVERVLDFPLEPGEKLLWQPRFYSYAARNLGILHARGDIIALTDSDTVPAPEWLDEGVASVRGGVDIAAGHIDLTFTRQPLTPAACYEKLFAFDQEKNVGFGRAATANLLMHKAVFTKLGLFDEKAQSGEDFAWTSRASHEGLVLTYSPSALVFHPARETWKELLEKASRKAEPVTRVSTTQEVMKLSFSRMRARYLTAPSRGRADDMSADQLFLAYFVNLVLMVFSIATALNALTRKWGPSH
jgi:glycosyltransferase involved in cell wall biosynthesis